MGREMGQRYPHPIPVGWPVQSKGLLIVGMDGLFRGEKPSAGMWGRTMRNSGSLSKKPKKPTNFKSSMSH